MTSSVKDAHGSVGVYFNSVVGSGSFGKICRAKCGLLPCVVKVFDESVIQPKGHQQDKVAELDKDCKRYLSLRHPSLIQYLGTANAPKKELPLLFMEVFNKNLTQFLQGGVEPLPFHMQVNICYDVALGLNFLHFNSLIHGSLSSNNVLLIGEGSRAKLTDFGFYKYFSAQHLMRDGSSARHYLAPEVVKSQTFSALADSFAFGVLLTQITTRKSPIPVDIKDEKNKASVTESRRKDIELIPSGHQLLPIALDCVVDFPNNRKSSSELCEQLAGIRKMKEYQNSREQYITSLHELRQKLQATETLLHESDLEIQKLKEDKTKMEGNQNAQGGKEEFENSVSGDKLVTENVEDENSLVEDRDIPAEDNAISDEDHTIPAEDKDISAEDKTVPTEDTHTLADNKDISTDGKDITEDEDISAEDKNAPTENISNTPDENQNTQDENSKPVAVQVNTTSNIESDNLPSASPPPEIILVSTDLHASKHDQEKVSPFLSDHKNSMDSEQKMEETAEANTVDNTSHELSNSLEQDKSEEPKDTHRDSAVSQGDNNKVDNLTLTEEPSILDTSDSILDKTSLSDDVSQESLQDDVDHTPSEGEKWSMRSPAPETMCALYGTVAVHGNTAYLSKYYNIYSYSLPRNKWCQLPSSTYQHFSLAVLDDAIVTIGGISREGKRTRNLYGLSKGRWRVRYSPMPEQRVCAASLTTPTHLVVAGGRNKQELDSVDIMEISTSQWHSLPQCLPEQMGQPHMTLCNDTLYLGGDTRVYSISLRHVMDSVVKSEPEIKWKKVKDFPDHLNGASLVSLQGKVVALGGHDTSDKLVKDICCFDEETDSWSTVDNLPLPHRDVLTAPLPSNLLLIVGGWFETQFYADTNLARLSVC